MRNARGHGAGHGAMMASSTALLSAGTHQPGPVCTWQNCPVSWGQVQAGLEVCPEHIQLVKREFRPPTSILSSHTRQDLRQDQTRQRAMAALGSW